MRAVFDSIPTLRDVVSRTSPRGFQPAEAFLGSSEARHPEHEAIAAALLKPAASISPKYFYDEQGSALFEAITDVPEYYVTRTERAVMQRHHESIADAVGECSSIIELGAGSSGGNSKGLVMSATTWCTCIHGRPACSARACVARKSPLMSIATM